MSDNAYPINGDPYKIEGDAYSFGAATYAEPKIEDRLQKLSGKASVSEEFGSLSVPRDTVYIGQDDMRRYVVPSGQYPVVGEIAPDGSFSKPALVFRGTRDDGETKSFVVATTRERLETFAALGMLKLHGGRVLQVDLLSKAHGLMPPEKTIKKGVSVIL